MGATDLSSEIVKEIHKRVDVFIEDNYVDATLFEKLLIRNAMLIGASVVIEKQTEEERKAIEKLEKA